jgi:hypothetical protein
MCQGVILTLVKWGRGKRLILKGVGSHSALVQQNTEQLKELGCKTDGSESVVSIESNFSQKQWNQFNIVFGTPSKSDLELLKREYKQCAGSASVLIKHVKKYGFDDALVDLLTAPAQKAYNEAKVSAQKAYDEVTAPAQKVYNEAKASALKVYDEVIAPAQKAYDEVIASAWITLFSKDKNRQF